MSPASSRGAYLLPTLNVEASVSRTTDWILGSRNSEGGRMVESCSRYADVVDRCGGEVSADG